MVTVTPTVGDPAFTAGATTVCQDAADETYTATATDAVITYSVAPVGAGSIDANSGVMDWNAGFSGAATITASAAGCNGPKTVNRVVTVTPTVGDPAFTAGATTVCQDAADETYTATATDAVITYSVAPVGAGSIDANSGVMDWNAGFSGAATITASAAGCNGPKTVNRVVTVTPTVGDPAFTAGATTVCQDAADETYTATATDAVITYSVAPVGAGTIDANTGVMDWNAGFSGAATITATATGCNGPKTVNRVVTVTPTVGDPAFTAGATTVCQDAADETYTATATDAVITYSVAPVGAGSIDANTGVMDWNAGFSGAATITASAAGCNGPKTVNRVVTVTPTVGDPAFTAGATTVCQDAADETYTATATDAVITYSVAPVGAGSIDANTGVMDWNAGFSGAATITATATGCNGPKTVNRVVTVTPTVGDPAFTAGATTVCQDAADETYTATATDAVITYSVAPVGAGSIDANTGVMDWNAGFSGAATITASAAGCNGPKTVNRVVTVTPTVGDPAFTAGATTVCQDAADETYTATATDAVITYSVAPVGAGSIDANTGVMDWNAGFSGAATITASAAGCNGPKTVNRVVTVTPTVGDPAFTAGATTVCQDAADETYTATATDAVITYSVAPVGAGSIDANTGVMDWNAGFSGAATITASATGCNGPKTVNRVVTVTPTVGDPAFTAGATTVCQDAADETYTATATDAVITYSVAPVGAGSIDANSGVMDWNAGFSGAATITASAAGCNGPKTVNRVVTVTPTVGDPAFTAGATTVCQDAADETYTATATDAVITYSVAPVGAGSIDANSGVMDWNAGFSGAATITASAAGCNGPKTVNRVVTVNALPNTSAITGPATPACSGIGITYSVTLTAGSTYAWTVPAGATITAGAAGPNNNEITVTFGAANGNITVTETNAASCVGTTQTLGVTLAGCSLVADFSGTPLSLCEGSTVTFTDASTGTSGSTTYSWNFGAGASPATANTVGPHVVTYTTPGVKTVTLTITEGASDTETKTNYISVTPTVGDPAFTAGATTVCQDAADETYTATATDAVITYSVAPVGAGSIDANTGVMDWNAGFSGAATITASAAGCNGPKTVNRVVTVTPTVGDPAFTAGATTVCQDAADETYTATATDAVITYSVAPVGAGTIDANSGVMDWNAGFSGAATITASAAGCNGPKTVNRVVTVTPTVGDPAFTAGATTVCQDAADETYTATATDAVITYSVAPVGAGSIDANTGVMDWNAGFSGAATITASAAGCNGPKTVNRVVTVTPTVGDPAFTAGATTVCQDAADETYTATATDAVITYSVAPVGAGSIDANTGVMDWNAGFSGAATITASAAGCNGPKTVNRVVTVTPTVGDPAFTAGATTVCQDAADETYTATATDAVITYSVAPVGAGSIDANSGVMDWNAGFSGAATITATATGCNGPKTVNRVVTVTPTVGDPAFTAGATTVCQDAADETYTATATDAVITYSVAPVGAGTIDANSGVMDWNAGFSGAATITASAAGCNGPKTVNRVVTVTPTVGDPAFTAGATTVCQDAADETYTATATDAVITYSVAPAGAGTIDANTGVMDWNAGFSGAATITASAAGCNGPKTVNRVVTVTPTVGDPAFTAGATTVCQDAADETYTATATDAVITYSVAPVGAGSIDANTGVMDWNAGFSGAATITASAAGCNGPKTVNRVVTVNALPNTSAITGPATPACSGIGITYSVTLTAGSTYAWTVPAGATITAGAAGPDNNQITVTFGSTNGNITVTETNAEFLYRKYTNLGVTLAGCSLVADFSGAPLSLCEGATVTFTDASTGTSGSTTYSWNFGAGASPATANTVGPHAVTYTTPGLKTVTLTITEGASDTETKTNYISVTPTVGDPAFTAGATTVCQDAADETYTATATDAVITYSVAPVGAGSIDANTGVMDWNAGFSGAATITASAAGCNGPKTVNRVVTVTPTVGDPAFTAGATTVCQDAADETYTATATDAVITYSVAPVGAGSIDANSGVMDWNAGFSGAATITASAAGCNGPKTVNRVVTVTPTVGDPAFTAGATTVCQDAADETYTATATDAVITYSVAPVGAGSIDANTGVMDWNAGFSGAATITATATGCNGPKTVNRVVTVTPTVGDPAFTAGATTVCQNAADETYTATATDAVITYSVAPVGAGTIDANTGVMDWNAGFSGAATITASAAGCNGPKTVNRVVTVTPTVGDPAFTAGATTVCQDAADETYTATATDAVITYSVAPVGAGSIDANSGVMDWNAGFSGAATITATATGCNGPKTVNRVVTVTPTVGDPAFTAGATTVCQDAADETYTATATDAVITYSVAPVGAGSIDANSGVMDWNAGFSGAATITASAAGCNGPKTVNRVVTVTPTVGDPAFTAGATTVCQNAADETYTATATDAVITYSVAPAGAGTIDANTGVMDWNAGFSGAATITASAAGCNGPKTVNRVVTVNALPNTSAITGPATPACSGIGITYSVTLTAGSSYAWTVPAGAIITAGAAGPDNNQITVTFGAANGNITVTETNANSCVGSTQTLGVTLAGCGINADFYSKCSYNMRWNNYNIHKYIHKHNRKHIIQLELWRRCHSCYCQYRRTSCCYLQYSWS